MRKQRLLSKINIFRGILTLLFLTIFATGTANWTGRSAKEKQQRRIQEKIDYLYKKYPPHEWGWTYDISIKAKRKANN